MEMIYTHGPSPAVELLEVCLNRQTHTHTPFWFSFPLALQNARLLTLNLLILTFVSTPIFLKLSYTVLLPLFQKNLNTQWKSAPFSETSQITYLSLLSAIACIRVKQHKLPVESYQLWKESCSSSTKVNHTVQRNIASYCTTLNTTTVGRWFHWTNALQWQQYLCPTMILVSK